MDRKGVRQVTPKVGNDSAAAPFVTNFTPGYIERALASWPKQGSKKPWRVSPNQLPRPPSLEGRGGGGGAPEFFKTPARAARTRSLAQDENARIIRSRN